MKTEYKRENHRSYLVIAEEIKKDTANENEFAITMISENKIPGLIPVGERLFNGEKELYYDISSRQSLDVMYEKRPITADVLKRLFSDLRSAYGCIDEYLLDTDKVLLKPEYIYTDLNDGSFEFLFYPFDETGSEDGYEFAEYILDRISGEDEDAVMTAYEFYRLIKEEEGDIAACLMRLERSSIHKAEHDQKEYEKNISEDDDDVFYMDEENLLDPTYSDKTDADEDKAKKKTSPGKMKRVARFLLSPFVSKRLKKKEEPEELIEEADDFAFDDIEDEYEYDTEFEKQESQNDDDYETMLIEESVYKEQRILSGKIHGRKKEIDLTEFPFIIGKSKDQADYCLDDRSVSRMHARFTLRDDIVYLTDLNSLNGTYKNGMRLDPNELVMLEREDEIRFGKCVFTYL